MENASKFADLIYQRFSILLEIYMLFIKNSWRIFMQKHTYKYIFFWVFRFLFSYPAERRRRHTAASQIEQETEFPVPGIRIRSQTTGVRAANGSHGNNVWKSPCACARKSCSGNCFGVVRVFGSGGWRKPSGDGVGDGDPTAGKQALRSCRDWRGMLRIKFH